MPLRQTSCLTLEVSGRGHNAYEDTRARRSGPLDRIVMPARDAFEELATEPGKKG